MNSGYQQWMRRYQVIVAGLDVSALRCTFSIEKSVNETPNYAQIVLYNLAASSIAQIKAGDKVILSAGYENGNFGMIFTGEIVQPYITREGGTDTLLHLICQDGDVFLNSAFTAKTLEKGSTIKDVVDTCATLPQRKISDKITSGDAYIRGKVLFGQSASYLKGVAQATDTQFFVSDEEISIVGAEDYEDGLAVDLNADTGLVGDPNQTDDGVSAKCLINPSIKLNTLVHIDASAIVAKAVTNAESKVSSFSANGVYRVVKLTYEGDTDGDAWYCNFDAITQDGASPAGTSSPITAGTSGSGDGGSGRASQSVLSQIVGSNPWR